MHEVVTPLTGYRVRNDALDRVFYDVDALAPETVELASDVPFAEGGIIVVEPGAADGFRFFASVEAFRASSDGPRTLAVAGVGSSAVGTAAFAKNVAKAVEAPVAGVVSGYGVHDVLQEAMGGWFWFRRLNQIHHWWEKVSPFRADEAFVAADMLSPDTKTLTTLFGEAAPAFDLIVGHSKGNLSIAEALYNAQALTPAPAGALLAHAHIVTISAAIYMPNAGRRVTDIIGADDWFGKMNSDPDVEIDIKVEGAWHHTGTTFFPEHRLDVTAAVTAALLIPAP